MTGHLVHMHASGPVPGRPDLACGTVCGVACGTRETTAYAGLDPDRVTCPACLAGGPWSDVRAVMVRSGDLTPAGTVDTVHLDGALCLVELRTTDGARFTRGFDALVSVVTPTR